MVRKKQLAVVVVAVGGMMVGGFFLEYSGYIPLWMYEAFLIGSFPVFVLCTGLWWMAREHDEDIPFIGY
jgi:hypothetical protein